MSSLDEHVNRLIENMDDLAHRDWGFYLRRQFSAKDERYYREKLGQADPDTIKGRMRRRWYDWHLRNMPDRGHGVASPQAYRPRQEPVTRSVEEQAAMDAFKARHELGRERYNLLLREHPFRFVDGQWLAIALYEDIQGRKVKDWVAVARTTDRAAQLARTRFPDTSCYIERIDYRRAVHATQTI